MRLDHQLIHPPANLLRVQLARGVRIEHGHLVDVLSVAGQGRVRVGFGLIGGGLAQALRPQG